MALLPPGVGPVGLQILLQPASSAVFARGACNVAGTIYPVYASYKAIESRDARAEESDRWLTYWTIYGALTLIEGTSDKGLSWFPYYYHAKLAFLLWLQMPQSMGAKVLYRDFMKPVLVKYQPKVDAVLEFWRSNFGWLVDAKRAELQALGRATKAALASAINFTQWFLDTRHDDGREQGRLTDGEDDAADGS